jgi:hypothetical protein
LTTPCPEASTRQASGRAGRPAQAIGVSVETGKVEFDLVITDGQGDPLGGEGQHGDRPTSGTATTP